MGGRSPQNAKIKIRKIKILTITELQKIKILKTFIAIVSPVSIAKLFPTRSQSCSQDQRKTFAFSLLVLN
jgi:hypothetical protein